MATVQPGTYLASPLPVLLALVPWYVPVPPCHRVTGCVDRTLCKMQCMVTPPTVQVSPAVFVCSSTVNTRIRVRRGGVGKINILYFFGPFKILHAWLHESIDDRCNNSAGTVCVRAAGGPFSNLLGERLRCERATKQASNRPRACANATGNGSNPSVRPSAAAMLE